MWIWNARIRITTQLKWSWNYLIVSALRVSGIQSKLVFEVAGQYLYACRKKEHSSSYCWSVSATKLSRQKSIFLLIRDTLLIVCVCLDINGHLFSFLFSLVFLLILFLCWGWAVCETKYDLARVLVLCVCVRVCVCVCVCVCVKTDLGQFH